MVVQKRRKGQMRRLCNDDMAKFSANQLESLTGKAAGIKVRLASEIKEAENQERLRAFDRQVKTLLYKGYAKAAGMKKDQFLEHIESLRDKFEVGDIIVIPEQIVPIHKQMAKAKADLYDGISGLDPNSMRTFAYLTIKVLWQVRPIKTSNVPYLLREINKNVATCNAPFNKHVVRLFKRRERFDLIEEEKIAIAIHAPEKTFKDPCLDVLAVRYSGSIILGVDRVNGIPRLIWAVPGAWTFPM